MKRLILLCLLFPLNTFAQVPSVLVPPVSDPFAHTFSIVAHDSTTGELGVAVQSHWFSVGSIVSWAEPGVGAIATQSFVNPSFGPRGLALLKAGLTATEAAEKLIREDAGRDFRQLAIVDVKGNVAVYTGAKCVAEAGHLKGKGYSVQANMMLTNQVPSAMARAFESSSGKPLAERMMVALEAAQQVGGDARGQQSAAILVVRQKATGEAWKDKTVDLRVEDHPQAISEMRRLLTVFRAYERMNNGDLAVEHGDVEGALREYGAAMQAFPENVEMKFWTAVSLANAGRLEQALPIFKNVFSKEPNWVVMTKRIVPSGILTVSDADLQQILATTKK
ncbi:MAG TPA: DUF1028 domain-containing protein [Rhodothermales bacterium]|nr:DUF1028 domain-containing protein [Rhodothermales bacterium]HRR08232.1 DUF1028 domain-containing protein [Rhodothermales bacterium]